MASLFEYYNTGDDDAFNNQAVPDGGAGNWGTQTFTPSINHKITSVKLKLYRLGLPGTLYVSIRATDGNGAPTGSDLCSGTTNGDTLTTDSGGEWREITLDAGYSLVANTKYAILHRGLASGSNIPYWREDGTSPTYTGGSYLESVGDGTWLEDLTKDCMFEEYGETDTGSSGSFTSSSGGYGGALKRKKPTTYQQDLANALKLGYGNPLSRPFQYRR